VFVRFAVFSSRFLHFQFHPALFCFIGFGCEQKDSHQRPFFPHSGRLQLFANVRHFRFFFVVFEGKKQNQCKKSP